MKKVWLHVSLVLVIVYVFASVMVLLLQRPLKVLWGVSPEIASSSLFPLLQIVGLLVTAGLALLFYFLLLRAADSPKAVTEIAAMVILAVFLFLSPYIQFTVSAIESWWFAASGAAMIANGSVLSSLLNLVRPISSASYLIMIIFSGVSYGQKHKKQLG